MKALNRTNTDIFEESVSSEQYTEIRCVPLRKHISLSHEFYLVNYVYGKTSLVIIRPIENIQTGCFQRANFSILKQMLRVMILAVEQAIIRMVLEPFVGLWPTPQSLNPIRSQQDLCLHTGQHTRRINTDRHNSSGFQTQHASV